MIRVLVAGLTGNPGGMESVVMNYFRAIDRNIVMFDFLYVTNDLAHKKEIHDLGGKTFHLTSKRDSYTCYKREIKQFFEDNKGVYSAIWYNACSLANIDYLIYAKKYGIPIRIIHCHNAANGQGVLKGVFHRINQRRIKKYATDFWTCSHEADKWFYNREDIIRRCKLINNAIDLDRVKPDEHVREIVRKQLSLNEQVLIGHVGRFEPQKNHDFLIQVFDKLNQTHKGHFKLILIGEGSGREAITRFVEEKGLQNDVIFTGSINNVVDYLQAMDVFVFPSNFEGLSVSLLEAEANGLPCIISNTIDPLSIVTRQVYSLPIDKDAIDLWVEKIVEYSSLSKRIDIEAFQDRGLDIDVEAKKLCMYFETNEGQI